MKVVIQKVTQASVEVDSKIVSSIGEGLLVLVGIHRDDTEQDCEYVIKKIVNLRLFDHDEKYFDKSVKDLDLDILCVSQFTLYGSLKKGNRPSFDKAMPPAQAKEFYAKFLEKLRAVHPKVHDGQFGALMKVSLVNDGPVTIIGESKL